MSRIIALGLVLGGAAAALGAAGFFHHAPSIREEVPAVQSRGEGETAKPPFRAVGMAGCAATACHGAPATSSLAGRMDAHSWCSSATHCLACDPHTRAFAALESPLAGAIMSNLHSSLKATEEVRCLACHTNPALANESAGSWEIGLRREGVSCEACHGNAQQWHHEHTGWSATTRSEGYENSGMAKLHDLGERALACAGCHVGAPADAGRGYPVRDMNHDMIAAGHPRLNFDFAEYQRRLPPHWQEKDRTTGQPVGPEFEARAWLVGRVAHAEAACRLLADREQRANDRDPRTPWPEFSEWSCVSCHHKLEASFPRKTGTPVWQTIWPMMGLRTANREEALHSANELAEIRKHFASSPEAESLATTKLQLKKTSSGKGAIDYDAACQMFHGLAALERTRMARDQRDACDPAFQRLGQSLRAPRGNLDFTVNPKSLADLKYLLERKN